ncbi:MAG: hypothetical protein HC927_04395, partial [Deltaproteobacteria bacterium]|nr:hypothetical protein [Deltaproteobacteria bacterium]
GPSSSRSATRSARGTCKTWPTPAPACRRASPDAPFYLALDEAALIEAFEDILAGVRSCQLTLAEPLTDAQAQTCEVYVNGGLIEYGDADGWVIDGGDVELQGASCDALQAQTSSVSMECSCAAL